MKSLTEYLTFNTRKKREYVNITDKVVEVVTRSGIREGMVLVSAMHITAGVFVNDAESGLLDLGPWQQVYYAEFDGQRSKRLIIKAMGD